MPAYLPARPLCIDSFTLRQPTCTAPSPSTLFQYSLSRPTLASCPTRLCLSQNVVLYSGSAQDRDFIQEYELYYVRPRATGPVPREVRA